MDRVTLETFLAVAETGSFSRAAALQNLTQPAISKRIAQLEDSLGQRLFDRVGRRSLLTEAGRLLQPRARQILDEMRRAREALADLSGALGGLLRLGVSHHVGLHRLPPVLRQYARCYPAVELDMTFLDSEQGYEAVRSGTVDIAVVTLAPAARPPLSAVPVWRDPLCFCVAKDHPLADAGPVALATLSRTPALLPGPGTYTGQLVNRLFESQALSVRARFATNYLETIRMMVSIGLGWSVLPRSMLDAGLVALDVGVEPSRDLGYVVNDAISRPRPASAFIEALLDHRDRDSAPADADRHP